MDPELDSARPTHEGRQQQAVAAARACAARHGVSGDHAAILHDSNHTIVHLLPEPLIAKVSTSPAVASLAAELSVATYLASEGAPVVHPSSLLPPGPHSEDGLEITFWEYCPHVAAEPAPRVHGHSLRVLHDFLASYAEPLRPWDHFDGIERVLESTSALGALPPVDRVFLRRRYTELHTAIGAFHPTLRPLHGEPHAANLLLSSHGPRWIDFESACLGPQEWDLTVLPDKVVERYFTDVDWEFLTILRRMRSLCVAVWCWLDPDRAPVLREAGAYHLARLKEGDGPGF